MGEFVVGLLAFGLILVLLGIAGAIYFIPWLCARSNRQPDTAAIFVLNLFLGWTFLGWVIALVWAFKRPAPARGPESA